jgi:hypothetical protein
VIALFWLRLKAQRHLLMLACVVVAFQLVLGQTSSAVLADREPPLSIAVQRQGDDAWSAELLADLATAPNLTVVEVSPTSTPDEVFRRNRVQGLLVVPDDFGARIEAGRQSPLTLYPAPGILESDFAREQVASALVRLRARHDLAVALEAMGADGGVADDVVEGDLLDVAYEGPLLQGDPQGTVPVHGVAALLVLLAWPHAALTVPTREDKHLLIHGRRAFFGQLCASMLVVWLVWLVIILLYFVLIAVSLAVLPGLSSGGTSGIPFLPLSEALPGLLAACLGFFAIMVYVSLLAALLAQLLGRHGASWLFLPLFLLNMTIGGGLWAKVALSPVLSPLVPVAAVATPGAPVPVGALTLFAAAAVVAAFLVALIPVRMKAGRVV